MAGIRISFNDLSGKTIGNLHVLSISRIQLKPHRRRDKPSRFYIWLCRCVCGKTFEASHKALTRGRRTNCGCLDVHHNLTHGATTKGRVVPEYYVWCSMRERCENPNSQSFKNYGEIGRTVCDRWKDYANFIADMGPRPTPLHTLERSDNNRGYAPDNCKWATRKEQMRNVRYNRLLTHNGRTLCVMAWAEELGIPPGRIWSRINRGWPAERALTAPRCNRILTMNHESMPVADWARRVGINSDTILERLSRGWPVDRALTEPVHEKYRNRTES